VKAAIYNGPGDIVVGDIPEPRSTSRNAIARVKVCTICGTDLKLYTVGNPRCKPPRVIGHELAADVIAVGNKVEGLAVGDRVTFATTIACKRCEYCSRGLENLCPNVKCISFDFDGGFAERIEIPAEAIEGGNALVVPPEVSDPGAALAEPLSCAINAQKIAGVKPGDCVVVVGAGPLGCINAEVAKAFGAHRVIVTQTSPTRAALARKLADIEVLEVGRDGAAEKVIEATGGQGADIVIATAPVAASQAEALGMVRKGGTLSLFASLPKGGSTIQIDTRIIHYGQVSIVGASDSRPCDVRDALAMLAAGKIDVDSIVTHHLPLDRVLDGIELMRNRTGLKIAIYP